MRELMARAAALGVRVHIAPIEGDPGLLGYYNHARRAIVIRIDLTPFEMRSVLAHELGHAYFSDECGHVPEHERRAERYAAILLVAANEYARAEALDPSAAAIADELGVTEDIIETYQQQCLQRLGERTYGVSRRSGLFGELAENLSS